MSKITASTQKHLDILDIKKNMVILKNGGAAYVLETNAINFDLLSVVEQDTAIAGFSALLNSLTFPIQIVMMSQKMDISEYINKIKDQEIKQRNPKIKQQISSYRKFITEELITKERVLDKKFYVVIPFGVSVVQSNGIITFVEEAFGLKLSSKSTSRASINKILSDAVMDLEPRKNSLIKEFSRMGLRTKHLQTTDLVRLFYSIYNGDVSRRQHVTEQNLEALSLVEPRIG